MEVEKKIENSKLQNVVVLLYLCEECGECFYTKINYETHFRNINRVINFKYLIKKLND